MWAANPTKKNMPVEHPLWRDLWTYSFTFNTFLFIYVRRLFASLHSSLSSSWKVKPSPKAWISQWVEIIHDSIEQEVNSSFKTSQKWNSGANVTQERKKQGHMQNKLVFRNTCAKYSFSFFPLKSVSWSSIRALAAASGLLKFILTLLKLLNDWNVTWLS